MVLSTYCKQRILSLHWQGCRVSSIAEILVLEEGIWVSKQGIRMFLKRFNQSGTILRKPWSGFPPRLSPSLQLIIEDAMRCNDETTATQLQALLATRNVYVSLSRIVGNRLQLRFVYVM